MLLGLSSGRDSDKPKKEKKEKKVERDEKYELQENVFIRWGNTLLANEPLKEFRDLMDTKYMNTVLQIVMNTHLQLSGNRQEDCEAILTALNDQKTNPADLAEGHQKAVLSLWWGLIQAFWRKYGPEPIREDKLSEAIRNWCVEVCKGYEEVAVCDFTSSWRDGHAFNCLLHSFDKKLIDLQVVAQQSALDRIENAFAIAEEKYKVPRLLMVKELHSEHLDTRSVVCYLMTLYLSLIGKSTLSHTTDLGTSFTSTGSGSTSHSHKQTHESPPMPAANGQQFHPSSMGESHITVTPQASVSSQGSGSHSSGHVMGDSPPVSGSPQTYHAQPQQAILDPYIIAGPSQPSSQAAPIAESISLTATDQATVQPEPAPRASLQTKVRQQQSMEHQSDSVEIRSRKSSSSSQKSGKSRKVRKEELTREFENCLEQVLTWLLEAEEELGALSEGDLDDLEVVRRHFKEFELFMSSLTDSQDTVGRVLHRGQLLCGKAETEEEREGIQAQLMVVNGRWEELRALAMHRQATLQTQLNKLQHSQIASIRAWLSGVEMEMAASEPVAASADAVLKQIEDHTMLQARLDAFQPVINSLSTFVAVVDECDSSEESVGALEEALRSVGTRWRAICEWAELRTNRLDGLADLCTQTNTVFETLSNWLKDREHELLGLKSAHHLDDPEQVAEQVRKLQRAEEALEAEHGSFVRLSQLSCELVGRLDAANGAAANDVRRRLDTVTQRWDNLVARIEEHSRTLVRSGKADLKQLKQYDRSVDDSLTIDESVRADRVLVPDQAKSTVHVTTLEAVQSSDFPSTDTDGDEGSHQLVERFLSHLAKMSTEMAPLQEWTETFVVSKRPDQVRRMISVCQEKLIEIKDQESKVNRLQLELEHMHMSDLNSRQLKRANDAFEQFAKGWARIVTKISEAMNVLTGHAEQGEEAGVARGIDEWIEGCDRVLADLGRAPPHERVKRAEKLSQQLQVQKKNVDFIEKDQVKKAILKKGLDIIGRRIDGILQESEAIRHEHEPSSSTAPSVTKIEVKSTEEAEMLDEIDGDWTLNGDMDELDKDLARIQRILDRTKEISATTSTIEKAETRKAEVEERRKITSLTLDKLKAAEATLNSVSSSVDSASQSDSDLYCILSDLMAARRRLLEGEPLRKEAERAVERLIKESKKENPVRDRVRQLIDSWKKLDVTIEDHISCARKEQKRSVQKAISEEEKILEKLEKTLVASEKASDAEECCEHLDNLESLLDKVASSENLEGAVSSMDESFVRESYARLSDTREKVAARARERVAVLSRAMEECERFEKSMADVQHWANHMSPLLASRTAADVSALDVPEEYKQAFESGSLVQELSREFSHWASVLCELDTWLNTEKQKENERFQEQYQHAMATFNDLKEKFAEFKQPKSFQEKLERTNNRLADIENALDDMTGIEGSACSDCLAEANTLVKKLVDIDEDIKSLEKGRQDLVQEGIFDKESSSIVAEKLHFSKKKTKELGLRAEGAVDRLEDCVAMYDKMMEQAAAVEKLLKELEDSLEKYARLNKENDEGEVENLMTEWNRNEAALRSLEDLDRLLRERAVRGSEIVYAEKRRRADALKQRLDSWNRTVQDMNQDEECLLLQLDELHTHLMEELDKVDSKPPEEIASSLRFLRGDRDRLSSRARQLAAVNPRLANSNLVGGVNKKWAALEEKLHIPSDSLPTIEHVDINSQLPFAKQVDLLGEQTKNASAMLDFETQPIATVQQWNKRVECVEEFLASSKPSLEAMISEGRKLADSGRMELEMHSAFDRLDDIVDTIEQLEQNVEGHRARVNTLSLEASSLESEARLAGNLIDALAGRNLENPDISKETRRELAERDAHLASLSKRSAALHAELPGRSPESKDSMLDILTEKVNRLENLLASIKQSNVQNTKDTAPRLSPDNTSLTSQGPLAMEVQHGTTTEEDSWNRESPEKTALKREIVEMEEKPVNEPIPKVRKIISPEESSPIREDSSVNQAEKAESPPKEGKTEISLTKNETPTRKQSSQELLATTLFPPDLATSTISDPMKSIDDGVQITFIQPTTMTMEVEDDEEMTFDTQATKTPPTGKNDSLDTIDPMEQVYTNLDIIEDAIAFEEEFPMERLDDLEERFGKMDMMLAEAERRVEENQMTLDMLQSEHTLDRINGLKKDLEYRRVRAVVHAKDWAELQHVLFEAEKNVAMGEEAIRRFEGRDGTPPLEALEERQMDVEQLLPRTEQLVCDSVRNLGLLIPRLTEDGEKAKELRLRVREVETRFREVSRVAREERIRLDARAVDQHQLRKGLEDLQFWCDETEIELANRSNPLDTDAMEEFAQAISKRAEELNVKRNSLTSLESAKDRLIGLETIDAAAKHEVRRAVSDVAKRLADLRSDLSDKSQLISQQHIDGEDFWKLVDQLADQSTDLNKRVLEINSATIYTPSRERIIGCRNDAANLRRLISGIKERVQNSNAHYSKLGGKYEKRIVQVITACSSAVDRVSHLREPPLVESNSSESQSTVIDAQEEVQSHRTSSVMSSSTTEKREDEEDGDTMIEGDMEVEEPVYTGRLSSSRTSASGTSDIVPTREPPKLSTRDESNNQALTQLRHWLGEMERDAGGTVDVSDTQSVRDMTGIVQGIMDDIRTRTVDVIGIQDSSASSAVKKKAAQLASDMDSLAKQCERRKGRLTKLGEDARQWEAARGEMELWLQDAEEIIAGRRAEECVDEAVRIELQAVERLVTELEDRKEAMKNINSKGNAILDTFQRDDAHSMSHKMSKINMRWSKFNDNLRIRRAVLEASLRSRSDFHSALSEFEDWLDRQEDTVGKLETLTGNTQSIKDTAKRREWIQMQKTISAELTAHETVVRAVEDMGRKLVDGLDGGKERNELAQRLDKLTNKWDAVKAADDIIKNRLEGAEQEWEKLTLTLSTLLRWIEDKSKETLSQQPIGGSLSSVMSQGAWIKSMEREMEGKTLAVKEATKAAHSYLMQHDLRPKMHRPGVLAEDDERDSLDAEQRRCGLHIHSDCEKLKEKWEELARQVNEWDKVVQQAAQRLQELEKALAECQLHLSSVEAELENTKPVEKLRLESLKDARKETEELSQKVDSLGVHVDDANDACGRLLAADMPLDQHPRNQLEAVNKRYQALKAGMRVRVAALRNAMTHFGPSSEHFLNQSVSLPWQRAVSKTNQLPYYIDHTTECTQWEHPVWVEMSRELAQFNRVKFIAYRTAMKLRALQKRLCLDLVDLTMLDKAFNRLSGLSNEESPGLEGLVSCLLPLFEQLHAKHPQQVRSVALAVDLCVNFLLNLFDPSRDGVLRVLSFKIALVVFSNAALEEKYRYLFNLVAHEGHADQKHVALLLYDLVHIPRLVGEAAAFGGSNVEPSVRSCFEGVRLASSLPVGPFLDWMKQEPQSIVWLPVMHRLSTAEFAKHQAKCNVCKMFPIVGLRYRCLRCFNLDLCQNCFFSQRVAKKHKLKHPMQEYAVPTTSSEDARDFARMVKNKFSRSKNNLGYLPVEVGEEGRPLASPPAAAHNPATDAVHQRTSLMAARLATLTSTQQAEPREEPPLADIKSPLQLINQVEQMQKDELDQLLQRLQLENLELKMELERKKAAAVSTPDLDRTVATSRRSEGRGATLPRLGTRPVGQSVPSLKSAQSQGDVMEEARALRLHKQRLEHRSRILEQQNEQLEQQLQRLKKVIDQQKESSSRQESWSAEREWAERHSQPPFDATHGQFDATPTGPVTSAWEDEEPQENNARATRMQSLLATVDDLGRAMESLVVSVVYDSEPED